MTQSTKKDVISAIRFYIDKIVSDVSIEGKFIVLLYMNKFNSNIQL